MKAKIYDELFFQFSESDRIEGVIWELSQPLPLSVHCYKYRLAYIENDACVVRFDNEIRKGDHYHIKGNEYPYKFTTPEQLIADFWEVVKQARS
jgi:hypothetical protein